jgi:hypothetical protein
MVVRRATRRAGIAVTTLLLDAAAVRTRREIVAGPLAPLASSLAADLEPLLARRIYFPEEKALLSRTGGRCPTHGVYLEFDPFSPHEHRCPICGEVFRGPLHYRFWIYWYQLWLAERAVHAAILSELHGDARFASLADGILAGYSERYLNYPNVDNVLGPTRPFFSTYLESIWLLQICVATDFIAARNPALAARVIERIVEPSRALIAEYDEAGSNRQVWNDAALLAAARLTGDSAAAERAVFGHSGIVTLAGAGLLHDGTWYEGENYHLFAHRGLWYGVTLAARAGLELPPAIHQRYQLGFAAPFATALPDFTLPARRDSQYAISLRQWRIAEHCELGVADRDDDTLFGALQRMYGDTVPRRPTGRATSSADVERNALPSALSRADLSWRALLFARPELPSREPIAPRSVLLDGQGIAVFRRDAGRVFVALDYGHSGGGHGHPDRLNLLLSDGPTRWLDDFGTGSYVDPSLHWYRSTLAHNAPLVDGASQARVHGSLIAFDERGGAGWISAGVNEIAPGVRVRRTIVVMPSYLVDVLEWEAPDRVTLDLPIHAALSIDHSAHQASDAVVGGPSKEDGFSFLEDVSGFPVAPNEMVRGRAIADGAFARTLDVWSASSSAALWWSARAPGPPAAAPQRFWAARVTEARGVLRSVLSWGAAVTRVDLGETIRVSLADGTTHEHSRNPAGWHIELVAGQAGSSIELAGFVVAGESPADTAYHVPDATPITLDRLGAPSAVTLGREHYRRSDVSWEHAGRPVAIVSLAWHEGGLLITVIVPRSDLTFVAPLAENPYDNESADINGDGVQLYVRTTHGDAAWMLIPDGSSNAVRTRPIESWSALPSANATWRTRGDGYEMRIEVPGELPPLALDVVINEKPRGRERRRGQLVLSGALGGTEFSYLRGDRHEAARLIPLRLSDE